MTNPTAQHDKRELRVVPAADGYRLAFTREIDGYDCDEILTDLEGKPMTFARQEDAGHAWRGCIAAAAWFRTEGAL